ncbi:DUF6545 domain-containing protein [Nocardia goodfellowii]|uniref:DUF6545 domain-containing protein n=1 Tax=Nocardia goodfellowii TaxID=882446 RepID=A0ABS4Q6Y1_9NOCA|nr:DUF6545 domain-containing protein [Nocardia goodfellowii]MBP2187446.1 hypothetical protein [Nocardia goodfellowii]
MPGPIPLWISLPALAYATAILGLRWRYAHSTDTEQLINRALSLMVIATLIEEFGSRTEFAEVTFRLFLAMGVFVNVAIVSMAGLFAGARPELVRRRHRRYNRWAVGGAAVVLALGRPDESAPMWQSWLVWAIFSVPVAVAGCLTVRACLRDLLSKAASRRQKLVFGVLLVGAISWVHAAVASGIGLLSGGPLTNPAPHWTAASCVGFVALITLAAVPLAGIAAARRGWDRESRKIRRLRPLWRDLTAAVPGVVLPGPPDADPGYRLYRTVVEIRDALTLLRLDVPCGADIESELEILLALARDWTSNPRYRDLRRRTRPTADLR